MKKILGFCLVLIAFNSLSQDLKRNEWNLSVGYLFEGEMYVYVPKYYETVGGSILLKGDWVHYFDTFANKFGVGLFYHIGFPYYGQYGDVTMAELGATLKARFNVGDQFMLKPAVLVGYRSYSNGGGTGLGVNGAVALQYQKSKLKPYFELGILSQPAGGNTATDITFSPVWHTSIGISF